MPLTPFPVNEFGGLNITADPQDIGLSGAVDLLNVDLSRPGLLRTRPGYTVKVASTSLPFVYMHSQNTTSNGRVLIQTGIGSPVLKSYDANTFVLDTSVTPNAGVTGFARVASGTTGATYFATEDATTGVGKLVGSTFTTGLLTGTAPALLAVQQPDNRLVMARSGAHQQRVWFSDPGAPETLQATSFVDLWPNDNEPIVGLAEWGNLVFAFKQSRFAVFTGNSTDSAGNPVFNYRGVDTGVGIGYNMGFNTTGLRNNKCAVAPEGVYFIGPDGVYLTTGGAPQMVSGQLLPWFRGETLNTAPSIPAFPGHVSLTLSYAGRRLWLGVGSSGTFVYTPGVGWSLYSFGVTNAVDYYTTGGALLEPLLGLTGSNGVVVHDPTVTTDNGSAISWSYTTGYSSAGGYFRQRIVSSGERKNHFKVDILGSGTLTHQVLTLNGRPNDVADTGGSVTLGTAPALARGSRRRGARGTHFAHKLSGSGAAVVSGMTYWLQGIEQDT